MKPPAPRDNRRPGRPPHRNRPLPPVRRDAVDPSSSASHLLLYGFHAVAAALENPRRVIHRVMVTDNAAARLAGPLARARHAVEPTTPRDLDRRLGSDAVHQGVLLETEPLPEAELQSLCQTTLELRRPLVVLDQVTDPHNVGAILRSAAVFGAVGLVMTRRNSPPAGGTLAKAASGALERVPIALVPNLAQALHTIGEHQIERIGLDGDGDTPIEADSILPEAAIVLGSEGKGLRRLTREHCDRLCRIGAGSALTSLNVSNAAAVALFAITRNRGS